MNPDYQTLLQQVTSAIATGKRSQHEALISQYPLLALDYAIKVLKSRWPEAESRLLSELVKHTNDYSRLVKISLQYANTFIKGPWPLLELGLHHSPMGIYRYAKELICGRWKSGEQFIVNHPNIAYLYAANVMKERWPKAEPYILCDEESAFGYARDVIKGRWPAAEKLLIKNVGVWSVKYAEEVIQNRWRDIEPAIFKSHPCTFVFQNYSSFLLRIALRDHNPQLLIDISNTGLEMNVPLASRVKKIIKYTPNYPYSLQKDPKSRQYKVLPADFPHW